ncbi:prephenate dehydrogenase [Azotosporobacter soli]|uniref:prephenate dehydrogenase n=1 Tax=Azotosporobacter soli TaxID=3055040 RepID=UPI0031FF453E
MNAQKIAVVGLGLIGGSLALALRDAYQSSIELCGVDQREEDLNAAINRQILNWGTASIAEAAAWADIIFLCTPVLQIPVLVSMMAPHLKPGTIISDVGSTKQLISFQIRSLLPEHADYVAGHPMAGRESSGFCAADKNLFRGKKYILLPEYTRQPESLVVIENLLSVLGADIAYMDAITHDKCAAIISHVPHVAAAALVNLLEDGETETAKLAGGGFKDTTRIASSNADMWSDICLTNGEAIVDSLENLKQKLDDMIYAIQRQDRNEIHQFFSNAKQKRDQLVSESLLTN